MDLLSALLLCELIWRALLEGMQNRFCKHTERGIRMRCALPLAWLTLWAIWNADPRFLPGISLIAGLLLVVEWCAVRPVRECRLPDHWPVVRAHERIHRLHQHDLFRGIWTAAGWILWGMLATRLASLPEALLVAHLFFFWSRPLTHILRWRQEYQADACAAECITPSQALQGLELLQAGSERCHALFALQYSSHPPPALRRNRLVTRGACFTGAASDPVGEKQEVLLQ